MKQETAYQTGTFISLFSLKLHIQTWKYFHSMALCSAGGIYLKQNRVLDIGWSKYFGHAVSNYIWIKTENLGLSNGWEKKYMYNITKTTNNFLWMYWNLKLYFLPLFFFRDIPDILFVFLFYLFFQWKVYTSQFYPISRNESCLVMLW